jgi:mRNA interferase MazF
LSVEQGEVWWARFDGRTPVVLTAGGEAGAFAAMLVVAPATDEQKRGFVVLSGAEAADERERERIVGEAGPGVGGVGAEIEVGVAEGLPFDGVVRVALPHPDRIFCTWLVTLTADDLIERAGVLPAEKRVQLDVVLRLSQAAERVQPSR